MLNFDSTLFKLFQSHKHLFDTLIVRGKVNGGLAAYHRWTC